jgi:hypothetical protein
MKILLLKRKLLLLNIGAFICLASIIPSAVSAQKLSLKNLQIPDTVVMGSQVTCKFRILNDDQKSQLGNLRLWFSNQELNNLAAPLGYFNSSQFFAPQQEREFEVTIPILPEMFIGGGNTVVIWPSFINIPAVISDSSTIEIFVLESNSIAAADPIQQSIQAIPNPVGDAIMLNNSSVGSNPISMNIRDLTGRILQSSSQSWMDISWLPSGIYLLEIRTKEGAFYSRKIFRRGTN